MTEAELFAAYRTVAGYAAQCACGIWVTSPSSGDVTEAVDVHNQSTAHRQWRERQAAVDALKRPTRICACHDHAGDPA